MSHRRPGSSFIVMAAVALATTVLVAQTAPSGRYRQLADDWISYSGDYTGRRFSSLAQVNTTNVHQLGLQWVTRITPGLPPTGAGRFGGFGGPGPEMPRTISGFGTGALNQSTGRPARIVSPAIAVDGKLYVSTLDNAWAIDARDGRLLWHYVWKTLGGTHTGNRGMGMRGQWLYMTTPDNFLICLDSRTGKERWVKKIAELDQQYFTTTAPVIIDNLVLVSPGNDLDAPGFMKAFDADTGEVKWTWFATPQNDGDPGLDSWSSLEAARHGGGHMWIPGSFDPETRLYITGTANPNPAYTSQNRGSGDNLYTCSLVALNVDTGKMVWHFSTSPHDTHDWDSAQTPVLVDAPFKGRARKLVLQATRNGFFFVLDRVTGEHLLTTKFSQEANWAKGIDERGSPVRNPDKDFHIGGALVSPQNAGAVNWAPPAFNPQTGLFYVATNESYAMYYLTETDPRGAMGLGGKEEQNVTSFGTFLLAIDYQTGTPRWKRRFPDSGGWGGTYIGHHYLTTAGGLLFGGDPGGNLVAYDAASGDPLWHVRLGEVSNAPQTFMLDGKQHVLVAAVDALYAFALPDPPVSSKK